MFGPLKLTSCIRGMLDFQPHRLTLRYHASRSTRSCTCEPTFESRLSLPPLMINFYFSRTVKVIYEPRLSFVATVLFRHTSLLRSLVMQCYRDMHFSTTSFLLSGGSTRHAFSALLLSLVPSWAIRGCSNGYASNARHLQFTADSFTDR